MFGIPVRTTRSYWDNRFDHYVIGDNVGFVSVYQDTNLGEIMRERAFYAVAAGPLDNMLVSRSEDLKPWGVSQTCALKTVFHRWNSPMWSLGDWVLNPANVSDAELAAIAAATITMVGRVHALGLIHGRITASTFKSMSKPFTEVGKPWLIRTTEYRMDDFTNSASYIDPKTNKPYEDPFAQAGDESEGTGLLADHETQQPAAVTRKQDMVALAAVLSALWGGLPRGSVGAQIAAFQAEMHDMPFSARPDYEMWTGVFNAFVAAAEIQRYEAFRAQAVARRAASSASHYVHGAEQQGAALPAHATAV